MQFSFFFINNLFFSLSFVFIFILNFFLLSLIIKLNKNNKNLNNKNIQNIHIGNISRLAGISFVFIIFILSTILYFYGNNNLFYIFITALPFIILIIFEDIFQNINPIMRLLCIFLSTLLYFTFFYKSLPEVDIQFIGKYINLPVINIIFFSIALTGYINGLNFIDGTNGLASCTLLTTALSLLFLCLKFNDLELAYLVIIFSAIITSFLVLNYPYGKIFLGDLGAYFSAWIIGIITVQLMDRHPEILSWNAVCILSYPIIELVFSFFRKLFDKKNPFYPDDKHLHLKLYFLLHEKIDNKIIANSLVTPILALIWLTPLILIPWTYNDRNFVLAAISMQLIIYFLFYNFVPYRRKKAFKD